MWVVRSRRMELHRRSAEWDRRCFAIGEFSDFGNRLCWLLLGGGRLVQQGHERLCVGCHRAETADCGAGERRSRADEQRPADATRHRSCSEEQRGGCGNDTAGDGAEEAAADQTAGGTEESADRRGEGDVVLDACDGGRQVDLLEWEADRGSG